MLLQVSFEVSIPFNTCFRRFKRSVEFSDLLHNSQSFVSLL